MSPTRPHARTGRRLAGGSLGLLLAGSLLTGATGPATAAPGDPDGAAGDSRRAAPAPTRAVRPAPEATTATVEAERTVPRPPASYPFQPRLKVFADDPDDASIERGAVPYDEIAPRLQRVMRGTDAVSTQVVGRSTEGRDIYLVTMTAPETAAQTAKQTSWRTKIRNAPELAAADGELANDYKTPIWFNGNIHGNEWEGADMTLDYIDEIVADYESDDAAERRAARELLRGHRLYFTVTNNPDGRVAGTRSTALGLDPNRDFITNTTPETTIIRDLVDDIQPLFFSDLHGYTDVLQVEPCGPPHGENYDYDLFIPHGYASARAIEDAVVEADIEGNPLTDDGGILIPYRDIPSGWDDWPPIFTAQYVAFHGAVTSTVELPLGRDPEDPASVSQPERTRINKEVGAVVMDTTVDYVADNAAELLDNQIEVFRRGTAGEELEPITDPSTVPGPTEWRAEWDADGGEAYAADLPRGYVIPVGGRQRSQSDAEALVDHLEAHDIEVRQARRGFTAGGTRYGAGSYVVDMHQPLRGLANSLLAAGSDISDRVPEMYDVSAWSPGLIWGATVAPFGTTRSARLPVATEPRKEESDASVPSPGDLVGFDLTGGAEVRALNRLLARDVPVTWLPTGTAVVGADRASYRAALQVAGRFDLTLESFRPAVLRTEGAKGLEEVTVGYTGFADDVLALGQMGFTDLVELSAESIASGEADLDAIDVLYVGDSLEFSGDTVAGAAAVRQFVADGGGMVGVGAAGAQFGTASRLLTATATEGNPLGSGIVDIDTPRGSLLAPVAQPYGFVAPATWFTALGADTDVEATYGEGDPLVSGHWNGENGPDSEAAAGRAAVISGETARGNRSMVFGTTPTFRTYNRGAYSQLAHGLYWAAPEGEGARPPVRRERVSVELSLVRNPVRVGQTPRVRLLVDKEDAERRVTVAVRKDGRVVVRRTVVSDRPYVIGLPAQRAGSYRIRVVAQQSARTQRAVSQVRVLRVVRRR